MAKGKKPGGTSYTSKGLIGTNRKVSKQIRRNRTTLEREIAQRKAWMNGKRVMLTVPNPDKGNTREAFIRVPASDVWGDPKNPRNFYRI